MSKRTLQDELRSLLLSRSLEAPDPDPTVEAILARTVASAATSTSTATSTATSADADAPINADSDTAATTSARGRRHWWPPSSKFLAVAAAVTVGLAGVAGANVLRNGKSHSSSSMSSGLVSGTAGDSAASQAAGVPGVAQGSMQPNAAPSDAAQPPPSPVGLQCSTLPGGQLVTDQRAGFLVAATGETRYVFGFYCAGANGERGDSALQAFELTNNAWKYLSTLIDAANGLHLQFVSGVSDAVTLQGTGKPGSLSGSSVGDVLSLTMITSDGGLSWRSGGTHLVAAACTRSDLSATVVTVESVDARDGRVAAPTHQVLQLTNHTVNPCALEGYPSLVATRGGKVVGPALTPTLAGPAGGVSSPAPPIVVLIPGGTAGAIIEYDTVHPSCAPTDQLTVTLPNGTPLGVVAAKLSACGLNVHPLVDNPYGSLG